MTGARLVVFDVDGTLVDSQAHILGAMSHAFDRVGAALPPRDAVLGIVGLSLNEAMAVLVPHLQETERAALVAAYKEGFAALRAEAASPLFPGARAAVERLVAREDIVLGIATGKSRRGLIHVLEAHGLSGHFSTLQVADDHPSKPHPAMLIAALEETGTAPARAVMIGDTRYDIEMAGRAGVAAIGVSWGYHPAGDLKEAGADLVIDDFAALDGALDRLWMAS